MTTARTQNHVTKFPVKSWCYRQSLSRVWDSGTAWDLRDRESWRINRYQKNIRCRANTTRTTTYVESKRNGRRFYLQDFIYPNIQSSSTAPAERNPCILHSRGIYKLQETSRSSSRDQRWYASSLGNGSWRRPRTFAKNYHHENAEFLQVATAPPQSTNDGKLHNLPCISAPMVTP